ncbi:RrF2 family transcriptional regulator [Candidatus Omnitrophota bacterium]
MKLLTKNTDYAIRALLVLAGNPNTYISARDIAKQQKIPYQYLRKILQEVINKSLVESKEGGKGGFKIKIPPAGIKVVDLINIFQGDIQFSECMFRKKICHNRATCVLRKNMQKIESLVIKEFRGITIGSLLKEMKRS